MVARLPDELFAALKRGATVITPHERAARFVRSAWDAAQSQSGQSSWATPPVHSWNSWTALLWHDLLVRGANDLTLLNPVQEQHLWSSVLERILIRDPDQPSPEFSSAALSNLATQSIETHRRLEDAGSADQLRNPRSTAHLVNEQLDHLVSIRRPVRLDDQLFTDALEQLETRCRAMRLLPSAGLERSLVEALRRGDCDASARELVLFAFDELVPARRALLTAWRAAGGRFSELPPTPFPAALFAHRTEDQDAELRAFAHWAQLHRQHSPAARIALISHNLRERRDEIEAALRETLDPEGANILEQSRPAPYEFSLGRPLSAEPLIQTALDLLRWTIAPLPLPRVGRLLLSTHIGTTDSNPASELDLRSYLDRKLRHQLRLQPQATLAEAVSLLDALSPPPRASGIYRTLQALQGSDLARDHQRHPGPRRASAWVTAIRSTLSASTWGARLSSENFQLRQRWEGLLDLVSTLDLLSAEFTSSEMFALLEQRTRATIFAPQSHDAPIQVLGPLEAAGQTFDSIWVMGCGDLEWPPQLGTNLLLSPAAQVSLGMSAPDPQRDRERAAQLTADLAASAPEVVFSYAGQLADAAGQRLSSLVESLHPVPLPISASAPASTRPLPLERLTAEAPIAPLPSSVVSGGARLLQLQSACGFRAFAELRLHAEDLETQTPGLDPRARGNAVHNALDALWQTLGTHQRLHEMPWQERDSLVRSAVNFGLQQAAAANTSTWDTHFLDVQRIRLHRLLSSWLDQERLRPPFTVRQRELRLDHLPVGPLHLSVRIDRIDEVNDSHILLDYKTSRASASAWKGDRPEQPQMLVYAILAAAGQLASALGNRPVSLDAIAFANVVSGRAMSLSGVQRDGLDLLPLSAKSSTPNLARDLEVWTGIVERLATEFANGDVRVNPRNFPETCKHCGQRLLCRLDAELLAESTHDAEDGTADHSADSSGPDHATDE